MSKQTDRKCSTCKGKGRTVWPHDGYVNEVKKCPDCNGTGKVTQELPMGVTEWKNHGIKYGYWDYFVKEVKLK